MPRNPQGKAEHVPSPDNTSAVNLTDVERARDKLYAVIFPNSPVTPSEIRAFERACLYQAEYDQEKAEAFDGLPEEVQSFRIGNFSASLGQRTGMEVDPRAYGILLREGLLYKGVERGPRWCERERIQIGYTPPPAPKDTGEGTQEGSETP